MTCTTVLEPLTAGAPRVPRSVVALTGEIDVASAGQVRAVVGAGMGGRGTLVVLDTSAVTFLDCAGLRELLAAQARLVAGGRCMRLRAPSPAVTRLLEWTRTTTLITEGDPLDLPGAATEG